MSTYLIIILAYLIALTVLNFIRSRRIKSQEQFMVAGRSLKWQVMVFTLICTWIGSGTFISGAEFASKAGFSSYLESLRNRLTRQGVNVITVKAGFVQTEMLKAAQKVMFPITAEKAAADIFHALRRREQQIYTPWFWRWIMLVIRNIPSFVFRRMSF